jgi:Response regulator of the LytR/AlgR family
MRIAVCDDEEIFRADIRKHIDKLYSSLDVVVDSFSGGKDLIAAFESRPYDLVFLDIEMPEMDGITLAKKLRQLDEKTYIVFLTGHVEYALEGYEVNALRYLTKPVQDDKLKEVLRYVADKMASKRQLMIKVDGEEHLLDISDILYLEAQNQYIMIYTVDAEYLVRYNLADYENELKGDGFFRTHRGYLVSLGKVKKLGKNEVIMEGNATVPVSRSMMPKLKDALYAYVENSAI